MFASFLKALLVVVLYTLALTLVLRISLDTTLELNLLAKFWHRDFFGNLVVSLACLGITQSAIRAAVLATVIIVLLQLSNALKLVVLGTPLSPDDFINVKNLYILWDGYLLLAVIAASILPFLILIVLTRWRKRITWFTIALLAACIPVGVLYSADLKSTLDRNFGNSVWNQPENFRRRGLGLHIVQETVRTLSKVGKTPSAAAVENVNVDLTYVEAEIPTNQMRNVHMVVLESFFDPNSLGKEWVPEDPLPADFTQLWNSTNRSTIMAPVFGGYTANAEFESLCGFPVTENAVFFEGWLRKRVPCLPQVMSSLGYESIASHPNVAGFWNRTLAYNLIGFDQYWSKTEFDTSDAVGNFVLDHSFYDQVFDKIDKFDKTGNEKNAPVFNYMLTIHGHLPYPTNDNYPDMVNAGKESALLQGYLNHVYYKSRDLMAMLDTLRSNDPDSLIVIFGDHLPNLGKNYDVYTDVGKMMPDRDDFTGEMFRFLSSTPLIVIDGQRGPLEIGNLPLYRLPSLILSLLNSPSRSMFDWTSNPPEKLIRPIYGMHFYVEGDEAIDCRPDNLEKLACNETNNWLDDIKTLSADIFTGKQFSLTKSPEKVFE